MNPDPLLPEGTGVTTGPATGARRLIKASRLARYGVAIGVAVAATVVRLSLDPLWGSRFPFILFFPAIMLSAWFGGLWPGVVTTVLATIASEYYWIEPGHSWAMADKSDLLGLLVLAGVGIVISALNEAWRRGAAGVLASDERLRVTLTSIGDAVIATDSRGHVTLMNAVAQQLTGWKEADAIGRPLDEVFIIINELTRKPADNPVHQVLREGVIAGLANHTVLVSREGREIPIDDSAAPIKTETGRLTGVVMVFRDITQRRLLEREHDALLASSQSARTEAERATDQLRIALESGRMGTWQYTVASGAVNWSPGLEAIHGLPPGTFPGTFEAFRNEIHPDDRDYVIEAITEAVNQRRPHHVEYRIVRADGAVRWVEGKGQLFVDANGQPERMVGVCADVTERKTAEQKFQLAVEAAPAAVIMVAPDGTIALVNALAETLFGYARDELLGQQMDRLVPQRFRDRHPEYRGTFFDNPRQRLMGAGRDLRALRKDGSEVPVEIGLSPIETLDGRFVLAAITDITERQRSATALEEANQAKAKFLGTMSHELRTPLNAIVGYVELLELEVHGPVTQAQREDLNRITRSSKHLLALINDILDFTKIEAGRIELDIEDLSVRDVLTGIGAFVEPQVRSGKLEYTLRDCDPALRVQADRERLDQILMNLLTNAIKFTAPGGRIRIECVADDGAVRFRVHDTGRGIPAERLETVFEPFVQVAQHGTQAGRRGIGLGLTISRELARAMRGDLTVTSVVGDGSSFTLELPRAGDS